MVKFELGTVVVSPAASDTLAANGLDPATYLARHQSGEWGDADNAQRLRNDWALEHSGTIRSAYKLPNDVTLLVNTAADRSCTWVMLGTEYQPKEVSTQEGYALWATSYDQDKNPLIDAEEPHVDLILARLAVTVALDAGTGTGRYARKLARRGVKVSALDRCSEMLDVAKQYAQDEGLRVGFQRGSLDTLPFKSNHFELVVCGLVLCHIPNLIQAADEFFRVTRDGGYLLVTDFHPDAVAAGWRTEFAQQEAIYVLPNTRHSRDDYLEAVEMAGFTLLDMIELYVHDIPDETILFYEAWAREQGDQLFGLIIFAQKVATAGGS
jgi:SAM-dependent methyltransferase